MVDAVLSDLFRSIAPILVHPYLVRNLATDRGWIALAIPYRDPYEWRPPRLGGVPIFVSVLITVAVALLAGLHFQAFAAGLLTRNLVTVLIPGTLIFSPAFTMISIPSVRTRSSRLEGLLLSCCLLVG